jgi:hypothetical protein
MKILKKSKCARLYVAMQRFTKPQFSLVFKLCHWYSKKLKNFKFFQRFFSHFQIIQILKINLIKYSIEVYLYIMKITIIRTKEYSRFTSRLPVGTEIDQAEKEIAVNLTKWPVIQGTGGIRKARFSIGKKGKRSGGRIWYFYFIQKEEVYLLRAYLKNEKEDLTSTDKSILKQSVRSLTHEKP